MDELWKQREDARNVRHPDSTDGRFDAVLIGARSEGGMVDVSVRELPVGTPVQVRNRYLFEFGAGFEIAAVTDVGYLVRRVSDGTQLPECFRPDEVRPV